jgi:predicted adenine nucleotide alpha hydrolase (AANH) superfamily ATPase
MNIILHICCGVCAAGTVQILKGEGHYVTGFFYNPNIYPREEYFRRLDATYKVAKELDFPLYIAQYVPEEWLNVTNSLEDEPEGGKRCAVCYRLRLERTFEFLQEYAADAFTSTLTISPHKPAVVVNNIGVEIGGEKFLVRDFKKKDGFKRAMEMARRLELYRQDYCGCIYSMKRRGQ